MRMTVSGRSIVATISLTLGLLTPAVVAAHEPDDPRQQTLASLMHQRVDVGLDGVEVREALDTLSHTLGITILGYWDDDPIRGLDPAAPVTFAARDVSAFAAMEAIVDQASLYSACTWQLRDGIVEVAGKARLCAQGRREQRVYDLHDLLLVAPYFDRSDRADIATFNNHPRRSASLRHGNMHKSRAQRGYVIRQTPNEVLLALARGVVELLDPGNWDHAGLPTQVRGLSAHSAGDGRPATIQRRQGSLIIAAPDFIHRALGGYPTPRRDMAPTLAEAQDAAVATRDDGSFIRLVGAGSRSAPAFRLQFAADEPGEAEENRRPPIPTGGVLDGVDSPAEMRRRLLHALDSTTVSVSFQRTPAREAFDALSELSGIPIIGRYSDDAIGHGIDPERTITLEADERDVRWILEAMGRHFGRATYPCTWQVRTGYIEVGTKPRLNAPAARELRIYHVRDLMFEPPQFDPDPFARVRRGMPDTIALELIDLIVTIVEPGAWDWGQDVEEEGHDLIHFGAKNGAGPAHEASEENEFADRPLSAPGPWLPYVEHPFPAIIRHWEDVMIVVAPDYIHRQLGGADGR